MLGDVVEPALLLVRVVADRQRLPRELHSSVPRAVPSALPLEEKVKPVVRMVELVDVTVLVLRSCVGLLPNGERHGPELRTFTLVLPINHPGREPLLGPKCLGVVSLTRPDQLGNLLTNGTLLLLHLLGAQVALVVWANTIVHEQRVAPVVCVRPGGWQHTDAVATLRRREARHALLRVAVEVPGALLGLLLPLVSPPLLVASELPRLRLPTLGLLACLLLTLLHCPCPFHE